MLHRFLTSPIRFPMGILTFFLAAALQAADRKPNVVLILIDDFGYECVTANGGESYKTPVMDSLAATGVRFEQMHVQSSCTPTRVALMTGINNKRNYSHFGHLDPSQKTFGNLFKSAGYATCITGKWQLSNGYEGPAHFGFDEYALWQLTRGVGRYKNPGLEINGKPFDYAKNEYGPDLVSDYALDFIARKKDQPFFLYYPMMLTHSPYDATPDSPDYLTSKSIKGTNEPLHFPDMVAYTDKLIGKLVAKLEELRLRDNTLVLILGDNGTGPGTPSRFQGRDVIGGKGTSTMWGTHVPGIGNWPGHFASGKACRDLVDVTDFLPTICAAAGVPVPAELKIDGRSFLPQLRGEKGNSRDVLYGWYSDCGGATAKWEFASDGQYKLYATGKFYDVVKDDWEKSPLADETLSAEAKTAKVRLQAVLKEHDGPRDEYFVKQKVPLRPGDLDDIKGKTKEQIRALLKEVARKATASHNDGAKARFEKLDADEDGFISHDEFMKRVKNE